MVNLPWMVWDILRYDHNSGNEFEIASPEWVLFNPAWLFIRATRKENQKWVVLLRKTTIISYEPPSSSSEIHWNPFHTFKNFHVGWHSSTLEPPAFWGVWHPWHLPNLASESCAIWVSCSRYVPTCSSAWEGITRNPPVNEHISPLKGTFESMMFLFPFGWDMLVPGRGTPCYTPMSMWTFHHQISLFKNGPLFESEQWIDLAPELVPVGIAHPSAVGTTNASNPNQQKSPNGWLRKNTTTSTVSKASRISKDFPRIEFFKHQVPCGGHNQMISPRYCDSRISRKWPEWCSFKRKAPVIAVLVFYVMILRTKHRKKHTFWHFEAY